MTSQTPARIVETTKPEPAPAPLSIPNGTLEATKWFALILMTLDHINKYVLATSIPALYSIGRIAMPLFVFVLAYNLARPGGLAQGRHWRTAKRLAFYGALACLPFIGLGKIVGGWWPLNILFTLALAAVIIGLIEKGGQWHTTFALIVFLVGGALVEYWWFALFLAVTSWYYCKRPDTTRLISLAVSILALWLTNQNPWGLFALPLILYLPHLTLDLPRYPRLFYLFYPAHLAAIYLFVNTSR